MVPLACGLGVAQTVAWGTTYYLPAILAAPVAEELGAPRIAVVGAFSAALLVSGLAAPRIGRAIEARGGRGVLCASSLILALGLALLGLLPGLWGWAVGWLVLGPGMALGLYDAAFSAIGRLLGPRGDGSARRVITLVTLHAGFASTIFWPLGALGLPHLGWRGLCLAYAAANLAIALPVYLRLLPRGVPPAAPRAAAEGGARLAWARRAFLLLAAFFTLRAAISSVLSVHLIALLEGIGLALAAAVAIASAVGAAQVGGRVVEFALGPRFHPLTVGRLGAALLPLGVGGLLLAGPAAALPFALAYGASNGVLTISRGAVPLALFGPGGYAVLMGRMAMPVLLTQALAPTLAAPLLGALTPLWVFALAGALSVLALICLMAVSRAPPPGSTA